MRLSPTEKQRTIDVLTRAMAETNLEHQAHVLKQALTIIETAEAGRPCQTCLDYLGNVGQPYCQRWKQPIPPEWVNIGCDDWIDEVPF